MQSRGRRLVTPDKFLVYGLDRNALKQILDQAPSEFTPAARLREVVLEIPAPDGSLRRFRIEDSPLLAPDVAAQFPDWKTYQGYGIDDPTATARFDFTPNGFHAYILSSSGTFAIDPFQENDRGNYIVYNKKDLNRITAFHCNLEEELSKTPLRPSILRRRARLQQRRASSHLSSGGCDDRRIYGFFRRRDAGVQSSRHFGKSCDGRLSQRVGGKFYIGFDNEHHLYDDERNAR